jgi:branched-chain amino acid transport system substrate-binding protein
LTEEIMDTSPLRIGYCVVGKVTFGDGGGWAQPRVPTVQFQNIETNNISEFKKPNTQVVVHPPETASVSVIYPYAEARR